MFLEKNWMKFFFSSFVLAINRQHNWGITLKLHILKTFPWANRHHQEQNRFSPATLPPSLKGRGKLLRSLKKRLQWRKSWKKKSLAKMLFTILLSLVISFSRRWPAICKGSTHHKISHAGKGIKSSSNQSTCQKYRHKQLYSTSVGILSTEEPWSTLH